MDLPRLRLQFIENAYTEGESGLTDVASFDLIKTPDLDGHWGIPGHKSVTFPNGDTITVTAEVTQFVNYLHVNDGLRRLCSLKTSGSVDAMFLLPSGEEAYACLELPSDNLVR